MKDSNESLSESEIPKLKDFNEDEYEARIPACCEYQTLEGHMEMMLCWGLAAAIREGKKMDCSGCVLATRPVFFARDK